MKVHVWISTLLMLLVLAVTSALGQGNAVDKAAKAGCATTGLKLPPGMAHADDAEQVAELYSERHQQRVESIRKARKSDQLTAQDAYTLKLIAYRTQLVNEQREQKLREEKLELEREARRLAEERAQQLERQRQRESIIIQHQVYHAYQRHLNEEYRREQRLRKILQQQCHQPCPQPISAPAPQMKTINGASHDVEPCSGSALP